MTHIRSSLASVAGAAREPDPAKARRAARQTYVDTGGKTVLINRDWLSGWADKELLTALAKKAGVAPKADR